MSTTNDHQRLTGQFNLTSKGEGDHEMKKVHFKLTNFHPIEHLNAPVDVSLGILIDISLDSFQYYLYNIVDISMCHFIFQ